MNSVVAFLISMLCLLVGYVIGYAHGYRVATDYAAGRIAALSLKTRQWLAEGE